MPERRCRDCDMLLDRPRIRLCDDCRAVAREERRLSGVVHPLPGDAAHRDQIAEKDKRYRSAHEEAWREKNRRWLQENREHVRA